MRRAQRHINPCRTAAELAAPCMHVRIMACPRYVTASCLCRSLSFVTPPYRKFLLCCRCLRMSIDCAMASATSPGLGFQHHVCMCAQWRVLAMMQRVVRVGACHLSPHHITYFCCAACACPSIAPCFPQHPRGWGLRIPYPHVRT